MDYNKGIDDEATELGSQFYVERKLAQNIIRARRIVEEVRDDLREEGNAWMLCDRLTEALRLLGGE